MRVGLGFDLHRLAEGRPLIIGGLPLAHPRGPVAHSDGDVLVHAVADALLGAAGLGDLGEHFPEGEPEWKDASGSRILGAVMDLLDAAGLAIRNVDTVVLAEAPRLAPHREEIRRRLAELLRVDPARVNVKATTLEGLGPIGAGEAIAAQAVVSLRVRPSLDLEQDL